MRKLLILASVAAATLLVTSCNKPEIRTPQVQACNCPQQTADGEQMTRLSPPPVSQERRTSYRHSRRYGHSDGYDESESYSGEYSASSSHVSVNSYSYRSASHVYRMDGDGYAGARAYAYAAAGSSAGSYASSGAYAGEAEQYEPDGVSAGGYEGNRAHLGARAIATRLDPWHGYNRHWNHRHHRRHY